MKKLLKTLLLFLLIGTMLLLSSCGYREERSSRKDRQVVATVGDYEVRYELVRALFHVVKEDVDGGDETVWQGEDANLYFDAAMEKVETYLLSIFGTFAYAESIGIDPYGKVGNVPTILCHQDSYQYGMGSNHADVLE